MEDGTVVSWEFPERADVQSRPPFSETTFTAVRMHQNRLLITRIFSRSSKHNGTFSLYTLSAKVAAHYTIPPGAAGSTIALPFSNDIAGGSYLYRFNDGENSLSGHVVMIR
jgi:hypothetical protein